MLELVSPNLFVAPEERIYGFEENARVWAALVTTAGINKISQTQSRAKRCRVSTTEVNETETLSTYKKGTSRQRRFSQACVFTFRNIVKYIYESPAYAPLFCSIDVLGYRLL